MTGTLYICSIPIGNLGDITLNVLKCLRDVPVIAAEDTRKARLLLKSLDIFADQKLIRMDQYQEKRSFGSFQYYIDVGDVAFISDSGSPGLSDPGALLIQYCRDQEISVQCFPGPSALTAFISGAGVLFGAFYFGGFLPRKEAEFQLQLNMIVHKKLPGIWFESPKRIVNTMKRLSVSFPTMDVVLAKELTKPYEQYFSGLAKDVYSELLLADCRGEWVCLFNGNSVAMDDDGHLSNIAKGFHEIGITAQQVKPLAGMFELSKNKLYTTYQDLL